jgi:hypothetical protein
VDEGTLYPVDEVASSLVVAADLPAVVAEVPLHEGAVGEVSEAAEEEEGGEEADPVERESRITMLGKMSRCHLRKYNIRMREIWGS